MTEPGRCHRARSGWSNDPARPDFDEDKRRSLAGQICDAEPIARITYVRSTGERTRGRQRMSAARVADRHLRAATRPRAARAPGAFRRRCLRPPALARSSTARHGIGIVVNNAGSLLDAFEACGVSLSGPTATRARSVCGAAAGRRGALKYVSDVLGPALPLTRAAGRTGGLSPGRPAPRAGEVPAVRWSGGGCWPGRPGARCGLGWRGSGRR